MEPFTIQLKISMHWKMTQVQLKYIVMNVFEYSQVNVVGKGAKYSRIFINNLVIRYSTITLWNAHIIFSNVILENVVIKSKRTDIVDKGHLRVEIYESTLHCSDTEVCGIDLVTGAPLKLSIFQTNLVHFSINLDVKEVMFLVNETDIKKSKIHVKARSPEYLRVPSVIQLSHVSITTESTLKATNHFMVKRSTELPNFSSTVVFDITNPSVIISESHFFHTHIEILSMTQNYEPILFSTLIEKSHFQNSNYEGDGGGLL